MVPGPFSAVNSLMNIDSNLGSKNIVASNVVTIDGSPAKNLYRKYNIKTLDGTHDDFKSINEVMQRRLRRGVEESDLPDLMVIDGGKGQLSSALDALKLFPGLELPIISLAKAKSQHKTEERIFFPGQSSPLVLVTGSPAYRVLTRIRDEAHRFAITFHRQKRSKSLFESTLDEIDGIGPTLRSRLLQHFGDVEKIRQASVRDLIEVKGITEGKARKILAHFDNKSLNSKTLDD